MTDDALKHAYRRLCARAGNRPDDLSDGDTLAALSRGQSLDGARDEALAMTAESTRNADLLRALRLIAADSDALAADVARLRAPASPAIPGRAAPRRWLALAASLGLAAVILAALQPSTGDVSAPQAAAAPASEEVQAADDPRQQIMVASFEAGSDPAAERAAKIFRSDFDS